MIALALPVVSVISSRPAIIVNVTAPNWHQATRLATRFAAKEKKMPAPVVAITERELALKIRAQAIALYVGAMQNLNGNDAPLSKVRERFPLYDKR